MTTVNLITGRKTNNPLKSELRHGDDRNIPQHIKDSIRTLEPCPINPHQAEKYLRGFYKKYIKEKKDFKAIKKTYGDKHKIYNQAERSYKKAFGRYLNIQTALETILFQQPKRIPLKSTQGERLYSYQSAYTIQNSGRLTELRGGFQSSPRILKHALTSNIKNLYNYDLVNSQANLLIEEFKKCGIKCQWLENYISKPNMKKIYAKRVGIPVEIWKNCFYALLMGAEPENKWGDIYNTIKNEAENEKEAEKQHKRFLKVIHDLTEATDVWRDYIYETTNRRDRKSVV